MQIVSRLRKLLYECGMLLRFVMLCRFEINCYVTVPTLLLFAFAAVAYHSNIPVSKDLFQFLICANK